MIQHGNNMPGSIGLEFKTASRVALLGGDYRGINFELLCKEGDEVRAGEALMRDVRRPQIRFNAPVAGRVARIERGARRRLVSVQIVVDESLGVVEFEIPRSAEPGSIRDFMLESGAWSSLRTRPFGKIPDPGSEPAAIFVSALDAQPLAPDPRPIVDTHGDEFAAALDALAGICDAPLYLCHAPGDPPVQSSDKIHCVAFDGGHSAGLPGVHINALCPIGFGGGEVWQLGYQDVIALGCLLLHATPWLRRVISLGGKGIRNSRNLAVMPGASIEELLAGDVVDTQTQILAGSEIYGRPVERSSFLQAGQRQLTVVDIGGIESKTQGRAGFGAVIPGDRLEAAAPPGIFPVPLMRALQLGDAERARELGALELLEEDVRPLSRACVSNNDYASLLRDVLDRLDVAR